jgi:hypothetical protein
MEQNVTIILLVDSEGPVSIAYSPWRYLKNRKEEQVQYLNGGGV